MERPAPEQAPREESEPLPPAQAGMKCTRCRGPARYRMPAHNARFCGECLEIFIRRMVEKGIKEFGMLQPGQKVLVAVSGGKDSAVLWQVLSDLGYQAEGLHVELALGDFSGYSLESARAMAERLGRPLHTANLEELAGHRVQEVVWANRRQFCSVCGSLKRHFINRLARDLGFDTLATGHHLDDEAGRLLGNMLRNHTGYLDRQWPVLEAGDTEFVRKVKPLCRLSGREVKSYAKSLGLPFTGGKCPMSKGATLSYYQDAVRMLEEKMPGTTSNFYLGFLRRKDGPPTAPTAVGNCALCGQPSHAEVCTVCRLLEKTATWKETRRAPKA